MHFKFLCFYQFSFHAPSGLSAHALSFLPTKCILVWACFEFIFLFSKGIFKAFLKIESYILARGQSQPRCPTELEPRVLRGRYQLSLLSPVPVLLGLRSPHSQLTQIAVFPSQLCRFIGSLDNFRAGQSGTQKGTKSAQKPSFLPILVCTVSPESTVSRQGLGRYPNT